MPITEDASTRQTSTESARHVTLQNTLFRSSPKFVRDAKNSVALKSFNQFLHQYSTFDTLFRHFDHQKPILVRNIHDIRNQHKKLHRIVYLLTKYFFHRNLTPGGPQGKI